MLFRKWREWMLLFIGLAGLYVAGAGAVPVDGTTQISDAQGALSMSASHQRAILRAPNLAPGDSVYGEASVLGAARGQGLLRLGATNLSIRGRENLAEVLRVRVEDQSSGGRVVFDGTLRNLRHVLVGRIGNGQHRSYRFTATLPEHASNQYAGASVSADFVWSTVGRSGQPSAA